ncbi:MAG: hypothetical protein LUQ09_03335 [Methanomassiliicoccales archaeon]|nr:hypothetical protein [Methanomassiliicoccales archaeon]
MVKIGVIVKIMDEMECKNIVLTLLSQVGKVEWNSYQLKVSANDCTDATVILNYGNSKKTILLEFKSTGEPRAIAEYVGRMNSRSRDECYPILVAPFISDRGRELCERSNIGCIDLSGNAFIKFDTIYINKWGNSNKYKVKRKQKNLLSSKSSWVIRAMLNAPKNEWTMQELSTCSSVSLAQVYKVLDGLEAENYLQKTRGSTKLSDPSGLLDMWVKDYRLNDQKIVGYYSPLKGYDQIFPRLRQLPGSDYALTLGAAAQLVLPVVRSTDVYMYVQNCEAVKIALELESVEFGGNVYLITPKDEMVLKNAQVIDGIRTVSNLQLYLDLYNYPQRGREQADAIREKILGV